MIFEAPFARLPVNAVGRDWVVGDLHGEGAVLDRFLYVIQFDPSTDRLIALGDLLDRGPDRVTAVDLQSGVYAQVSRVQTRSRCSIPLPDPDPIPEAWESATHEAIGPDKPIAWPFRP